MCSRVFIFLMGALYTCSKVLVLGDVYIAELVMESNITLDAKSILSILNTATSLQVNSTQQVIYTVTFLQNEVTTECLIIGTDTSCNCSTGYTWSNDVCYNYNCCSDTTCTANVSYITPLCIHKVDVQISGSIILNSSTWDNTKTAQLQNAFQALNGFQYLNITESNTTADFKAAVSVRIETSRLQATVTKLQTALKATITVNTLGMVTIVSPNTTVCYKFSPVLKCTFEEVTDSAGWSLTQKNQRFELNTGSVVKLNYSCATSKYNSCIEITLQKVTGAWVGTYECGFTTGSVRHTARAELNVALLPDVITMVTSPLTVDCSQKQNRSVQINISTPIPQNTETYEVWWSYNDGKKNQLYNTSIADSLVYNFTAQLQCEPESSQNVTVTFKNTKMQEISAQVDIPVIYERSVICSENVEDEVLWPKTPAGATVINRTCAEGRVGYKERTCGASQWKKVFDYCINKQLNTVLNEADGFLKGLGATQDRATNIFQGLINSSTSPSSQNIADITASINILNIMANASDYSVLQEGVFPNFINAASNVVNNTWDATNKSILHSMSSTYLQSVEDLVKNIKVNMSQGVSSSNIDLKFCSSSECSVSIFDVGVNMNKTNGTLKTVAVKNLMNKLRNDYSNTEPTSLLLSATLQDNNDSSLEIRLDFPNDQRNQTELFCVFWNTTEKNWSDEGCSVNTSDENHTVCVCNHLTSFSVLTSKGEISAYSKILDIITNVGLGVSICSLLIFLTIESLVWSAVVKTNLAHFRHTAMVNIATFLLLADISFLASTSPDILSDSWCLVLTICKHLFYLAMFCWMLCLSVMLVHQLIFVFSPLRKSVFMFFSSLVGYVCPILIVGSSYVYYKYTNNPYYDKKTCWLLFNSTLAGSIHAFLLPVGTVIFTNLFCMLVIIVTLVKSWVPDPSKAHDKVTAKSMLKVVVVLTPVFGITWIIGFFHLMLEKTNLMYDAAEFCFTILNSFQGVFILLTGCFTEQKVREELFKIMTAKSKGKSDTMKNLISTTYTKDK